MIVFLVRVIVQGLLKPGQVPAHYGQVCKHQPDMYPHFSAKVWGVHPGVYGLLANTAVAVVGSLLQKPETRHGV